ncbi:MAG: hypothetical protein V4671_22920 [Armatimonadota bacterium]
MSEPDWRTKAVEAFPEMTEVFEEVENPMGLWLTLADAFERAYDEPRDESLIQRIYAFADWCLVQKREKDADQDLPSCVAVCFYEHIPTRKASREDMPRWFTWQEVAGMRSIFGYHLADDEFDQLRRLFADSDESSRKRKRRQPRKKAA